MGWFDNQIRLRKLNDDQALDHTFRKIARAVTGDGPAFTGTNTVEVTQNAIEAILNYYHVKKRDIPKKIVTLEEKLNFALHS